MQKLGSTCKFALRHLQSNTAPVIATERAPALLDATLLTIPACGRAAGLVP